jgi:hypothetical protein
MVRPSNVIKVAPFNHLEAFTQLENDISVMQMANTKDLAREVVPMRKDYLLNPQVCAASGTR